MSNPEGPRPDQAREATEAADIETIVREATSMDNLADKLETMSGSITVDDSPMPDWYGREAARAVSEAIAALLRNETENGGSTTVGTIRALTADLPVHEAVRERLRELAQSELNCLN